MEQFELDNSMVVIGVLTGSVKVPADTTLEAEEVQLKLLRDAPPSRKLDMAFALNRTLKRLIIASVGAESPADIHRAFAERWLGSDLAERAYGAGPSTWR